MRVRTQETNGPQLPRLLRTRSDRPGGRRAAEQRDELAALHSITSSARAISLSGIERPSVLAVLRLMMKLKLGRLLNRQRSRSNGRCRARSADEFHFRLRTASNSCHSSRPRKEVRPDKALRGRSRPFWSGRSGPRLNLEFTRLLVTAFRLFAFDD